MEYVNNVVTDLNNNIIPLWEHEPYAIAIADVLFMTYGYTVDIAVWRVNT